MAAKETKEVIVALRAIVPPVITVLKDGFQVNDITTLVGQLALNPEIQAKVKAAVENSKAIPEEFKNLTAEQMVELAGDLTPDTIGLIMDVIAALRKA